MKRHEIIDLIQDIQLKVEKIGFKGQNEYDLHLREELADWIIENFINADKELSKNEIEIEFANGIKISILGMDSEIFGALQEKYKSAIIKIDGQPSAFWGMTENEIEKELQRVLVKKNERDEAIKKYQSNCKHDKGYVTNTRSNTSKCSICGKPFYAC